MKHLLIPAMFWAALLPAALGQDSSVNVVTGAGYLYPAPAYAAPGQLITVFVAGNVQGNLTATVQQVSDHAAPVLAVTPPSACIIAPSSLCSNVTAVTIQIPYEVIPTCFVCATPATFNTQLFISVNGAAGALFALTPLTDRVHIVTSCDTITPTGGGYGSYNGLPCSPLVTHADGSLVSSASPAVADEEVIFYAVGLGATTPAVATGQAATGPTPTTQTFFLDFNYRPNALATKPQQYAGIPAFLPSDAYVPRYAGLAPGYVGLYQVNLVIPSTPSGLQACSSTAQSNLTVSIGGAYSFDGAGICVAPGNSN